MMVRLPFAVAASLGLHLVLMAGVGPRLNPSLAGGTVSALSVSFRNQVSERSSFVEMKESGRLPRQQRTSNTSSVAAGETLPIHEKAAEVQAAVPDDGWGLSILPPEWLEERVEYLPASDVDERPIPLGPVVVPPPNDAAWNSNKGHLVLLLYVNAKGVVERAEVEFSDVPESVSNAAIQTFTGVEMQPGIKGGVSVNTKMKVQIDYDAIIQR